MIEFLTGWLASTPGYMTPLLLASLGLILCERTGVMNLGAEGLMAVGAVTGAMVTLQAGSPWTGLLAGTAAGLALSMPVALAVIVFRAEQTLAGLAVVALGAGFAAVFGRPYLHKPFGGIADWDLAGWSSLPLVGPALFRQDPLVYAAILLALGLAWLLARTRLGLRLRAAGEDPATADAAGVDVQLYQLGAVLVPTYLLSMLPYLLTILVLIIISLTGAGRGAQPAALGRVYLRQDRQL